MARYLLHLAGRADEACLITHLQPQKLMDYVQGSSLAYRGEALFKGEIQAWTHGPVVKPLYTSFASDKEGEPISPSEARVSDALSESDRSLFLTVWER